VIDTAIRNVATHVAGLKVPRLNNLYKIEPGKSSQMKPASGISKTPNNADITFITRSIKRAFFVGKPSSRTNGNSSSNPNVIGIIETSRVSSMRAGQITSAYAGAGRKSVTSVRVRASW
jgi:hypothetical protein